MKPRKQSAWLSFHSAVLGLVAIVLLLALASSGVVLNGWLEQELEARSWRDIEHAPAFLEDRNRAIGDALMMHAKEVAHAPELVGAIVRGDSASAVRAVQAAARALNHTPLLITADGSVKEGPALPRELVSATQRGEMPVAAVSDGSSLFLVSLAPVESGGSWMGAAGVANPLDSAAAAALAGLTRSDLVLFIASGTAPVASTSLPATAELIREIALEAATTSPREVAIGGDRYLVVTGGLAGATVAFVRDLRRDMAILPRLRRVLLTSGAAALAVALVLGSLLALVIVRPVRSLASAADKLSQGDFNSALPTTPVREVMRVSQAFDSMRASLAGRIDDLRTANRMLEERQSRLAALQAELIRRERVAASGRIVAELAHEIRNPVANLRNCLELIHRRLKGDEQGQQYTALAIDELLRMHELAERMLDLNRPRSRDIESCDALEVAREVVALSRITNPDARIAIDARGDGPFRAAIPADALKQVLLNLVQNAQDAVSGELSLRIELGSKGGTTSITLDDNGPGVPADIRARVFDPFFTTRERAGGIGLGLYVVDGVVRGHGGKVWLEDADQGGARFHIVIPAHTLREGPLPEESARSEAIQ